MSAGVALEWAHDQVGVRETSPNWSPKIGTWIRASGYTFPVPWCQCFANAVAVQGGAPQPSGQAGYTPHFWNGRYEGQGYEPIPLSQAQPGDFVYFDWSMGHGDPCDHVGVLVSMTSTTVTCLEGNTSSSSAGSQNNGGGVWKKTRSRSLVRGAVSVPYRGAGSKPFRSLVDGVAGADVRAFQVASNLRATRCGRPDRVSAVDGVVGPETIANGAWAAWLLGVGDSQAELRSGGISPYVQTLVRDPDERNETQKARAAHRREEAGCSG